MSVYIMADDRLAYDSRLDDYALLGCKVTAGVNKGGTAEITMPTGHPAYNFFTSYKTIVTVYRNGAIIFRGRALYPEDDFYNRRKIICEGERCFLRDGVMRPYLYQDSPAAIFEHIIGLYNAQVEAEKQFQVGTVNVIDPNNYVRLESENAEQISDTIDKLVERVGGYIVFTTNSDGHRVINWHQSLDYQSNQAIEFGENLLDFARTGSNTDLATVIIPYGAKDETTGERLTIESVNDGLDFIQDYDAVALRGVIAKPITFDDVTTPENLLRKAQQYLATSKMIVTSLSLSAIDLSAIDQNIDTYQVGDTVHVRSKPHNVDDRFLLQERVYDLLDPANDRINLGKDISTLTGADVYGDRNTMSQLQKTEHSIRANYKMNIAQAVEEAKTSLASLIQQTSDSILLTVSETYAVNSDVQNQISTRMTQLSDSFTFDFEQLRAVVDENDTEARTQFETIAKYIRFENGNIILGEAGNEIVLRIENDRISFLDGGAEVAYFSNKQLTVLDGHFLNSLRIGKFAFLPRENGNLSLVKVGD